MSLVKVVLLTTVTLPSVPGPYTERPPLVAILLGVGICSKDITLPLPQRCVCLLRRLLQKGLEFSPRLI